VAFANVFIWFGVHPVSQLARSAYSFLGRHRRLLLDIPHSSFFK